MLSIFLQKLFGKSCCIQENKIVYQVCGSDRFAGTTFVVDQFDSRSKAEAKLKECRDSVMNQHEALRDSFWISETTLQNISEQQKYEAELREARLAAQSYDREILKQDAKILLNGMTQQLVGKHITLDYGHDAECMVENDSHKMCYCQIIFGTSGTKSGGSYIDLEIKFKDGGKISSVLLFFKSEEEERIWLESEESLAETVRILEDSIKEYFES